METDLFTCPVCRELFDLSEHLPKVLPSCGHTFCKLCLDKLSESKCPLDKIKIEQAPASIPVNFVFKQLIELREKNQKNSEKICQKHPKEKLSFVRLADASKICNICLEEEKETQNIFKTFTSIKALGDSYKEKIAGLLSELENYRKKTIGFFEKNRAILENIIEKKFQEIKELIQNKEKEMKRKLYSFFNLKDRKIEILLGANSKLIQNLLEKSSDMENITEKDEYIMNLGTLSNIDQEIDNWKSIISSCAIGQKIEEELCNINKYFEDCLTEPQDHLRLVTFPKCEPLELLIKNFSISNNLENSWQDSDLEIIPSQLKIILESNCLKVTSQNTVQAQLINIKEFSKAQEIELCLTDNLVSEDLELLKSVLESIKNASNWSFKFGTGIVHSNLDWLLKIIPETISMRSLELSDCKIVEQCKFVSFLEALIDKSKHLKQLKFLMEGINIPGTFLKIFKKESFDPSMLEDVYFDLRKTDITDNDLACILCPMPNLRSLCLLLQDTNLEEEYFITTGIFRVKQVRLVANKKVTDKSIGAFYNTLLSIRSLEKLNIKICCEGVSTSLKDSIEVLMNKINL